MSSLNELLAACYHARVTQRKPMVESACLKTLSDALTADAGMRKEALAHKDRLEQLDRATQGNLSHRDFMGAIYLHFLREALK